MSGWAKEGGLGEWEDSGWQSELEGSADNIYKQQFDITSL